MSTRIILIRHAATDTYARLCGSLDVPLSMEGDGRCAHSSPSMRPAPDALFSSPLIRAREVAGVFAEHWLLELHTANWAREIHCGLLEGIPRSGPPPSLPTSGT
jgi:broad specificity phosphatase PhoE